MQFPGEVKLSPRPLPSFLAHPWRNPSSSSLARSTNKKKATSSFLLFCRTKGYYSWVGNFALTLSLSSLTLAGRKEEALHAQFYISRSERKGEEEGGVSLHFSTLTDKQARVIWPLKTFERMMTRPRLFNSGFWNCLQKVALYLCGIQCHLADITLDASMINILK